MPQTIWKGAISFGLVTIPVKLYAATEDLPGGSYVGPDGFHEGRGHPTLVGRSAAASDAETARALWDASEQLTGVTFGRTPTHRSAW